MEDTRHRPRNSEQERTYQRSSVPRTVVAGVAGAVVFVAVNILGFMLAEPILFDPDLQSAKLIAVWEEIEPLPPAHGEAVSVAILMLIGVGRAFVYRWLAPAWPTGLIPRALRYALLVWFLTFFYVEYFAPFDLLGEPVGLVLIELVIFAVVVLAEALVVAGILERPRTPVASD